jgi:hypothetical protein
MAPEPNILLVAKLGATVKYKEPPDELVLVIVNSYSY